VAVRHRDRAVALGSHERARIRNGTGGTYSQLEDTVTVAVTVDRARRNHTRVDKPVAITAKRVCDPCGDDDRRCIPLRRERNGATALRGGGSQFYSLQLEAALFPPGTRFESSGPRGGVPPPFIITASARLLPRH
jgi:hypothetical protein